MGVLLCIAAEVKVSLVGKVSTEVLVLRLDVGSELAPRLAKLDGIVVAVAPPDDICAIADDDAREDRAVGELMDKSIVGLGTLAKSPTSSDTDDWAWEF